MKTLSVLTLFTLLAACSRTSGRQVAESASPVSLATRSGACDETRGATGLVVCRANAFLHSLSDEQRRTVMVEYTAEKAARWSNLPCGLGCRNGLHIGDLTEAQRNLALALAESALGSKGFASFEEIRLADAYLADQPQRSPRMGGGPPRGGRPPNGPPRAGERAGGGPPPGMGPGGLSYGAGRYNVAFLGVPTDTGRWILQLGGHHYAAQITFAGETQAISITPNFVGVEPASFTLNGTTHAPLNARRDAIYGLIASLTPTQLAQAKLSESFDDVVVGPGHDGQFPQATGLPASSLTQEQRLRLRAAIEAWVDDAPADLARRLMDDYASDSSVAQMHIAWAGATTPTVAGSYVRLDGPRVWIEFACQNGIVIPDRIHFHTIWRDKQRDYGGSFR